MTRNLSIALLIGLLSASAWADEIRWTDRNGNTGSLAATWGNLQTAITSAQAGTTNTQGFVQISGNITRLDNSNQLSISGQVNVSGGWDSLFATQTGRSVINADAAGVLSNIRVFSVSSANVTMSSLEVMGGYITGATNGAGIAVTGTPTSFAANNLYVHNNSSVNPDYRNGGGGFYIAGGTGIRISNSIISNNSTSGGSRGEGGGLLISATGSAAAPLIIENTTISSNTAGGSSGYDLAGGAIRAIDSTYVIANSKLANNVGRNQGTAICASGSSGTIFGTLITGGSGETGTSTIYDYSPATGLRLVNSTVTNNTSVGLVSGGYSGYLVTASRISVVNSIVQDSQANAVYAGGTYACWGYLDYQNTTTTATSYTYGDTAGSHTVASLAAALAATDNRGIYRFSSRNSSGTLTQNIEANLVTAPTYVGTGNHPYQQTAASNSVDNGLIFQTTLSGLTYKFVDINTNNAYNAMTDIIVDLMGNAAPTGSHLVYTTDLAGNARIADGAIDRGAYELATITPTTYQLDVTAVGTSRLFQGKTTSVTSRITNTGTGTADSLTYNKLTASAASGTFAGATGVVGPINSGGATSSNSSIQYTAAADGSGLVTLSAAIDTANGGYVHNTSGVTPDPTGSSVATMNIAVLAPRGIESVATVDFGKVLRNAVVSSNVTLTSTAGSDNAYTRIKVAGDIYVGDLALSVDNGYFADTTSQVRTLSGALFTMGSGLNTTDADITTAEAAGVQDDHAYGTVTIGYDATVGWATAAGAAFDSNEKLQAVVAASTSLAGLYSEVHYGTGIKGTSGELLDGFTDVAGGQTVAMNWRQHSDPADFGAAPISDVLELTLDAGNLVDLVGGGRFVLQMSYDKSDPLLGGQEAVMAPAGAIYIVTRDPSGAADWLPAVNLSLAPAAGPYNSQSGVGTWGVDTTGDTHYVWVVLDNSVFNSSHLADFAVVPEPATLAFLALGGLSMLGATLRRRRSA